MLMMLLYWMEAYKHGRFTGLEVNAEETKYMVHLMNRMRDKITI
jgi:hypothetical protein